MGDVLMFDRELPVGTVLNWYLISFVGGSGSTTTWASVRVGYITALVTEARLSRVKADLGLEPNAVPIAVSLLGRGTAMEFRS